MAAGGRAHCSEAGDGGGAEVATGVVRADETVLSREEARARRAKPGVGRREPHQPDRSAHRRQRRGLVARRGRDGVALGERERGEARGHDDAGEKHPHPPARTGVKREPVAQRQEKEERQGVDEPRQPREGAEGVACDRGTEDRAGEQPREQSHRPRRERPRADPVQGRPQEKEDEQQGRENNQAGGQQPRAEGAGLRVVHLHSHRFGVAQPSRRRRGGRPRAHHVVPARLRLQGGCGRMPFFYPKVRSLFEVMESVGSVTVGMGVGFVGDP